MKNSLSSKTVDAILKISGTKKKFENKKFLQVREKENKKLVTPPPLTNIGWEKVDQYGFYYYQRKTKSKRVIFYFHGGAFVASPLFFHWNFLKKLSKKTKANIVFPIYPKAPEYSYKDSYKFLFKMYEGFTKNLSKKDFIFMGDSAGGNIALSFAEQLKAKGQKTPKQIVLFSPCLDLTLSNPEIDIIEQTKADPMLSKKGLQIAYNSWAKGDNLKNYKLSPINGDFSDLGKISLFVGTNEILFPEARRFKCLADKKGIDINYVQKQNMLHAYPLHPTKEADEAFKDVVNIVLKNKNISRNQ